MLKIGDYVRTKSYDKIEPLKSPSWVTTMRYQCNSIGKIIEATIDKGMIYYRIKISDPALARYNDWWWQQNWVEELDNKWREI